MNLTSDQFSGEFRIIRRLTTGTPATYEARHIDGDTVLLHWFADGTAPKARAAVTRLQSTTAARGVVRDVIVIEGATCVVTAASPSFRSFDRLLESATANEYPGADAPEARFGQDRREGDRRGAYDRRGTYDRRTPIDIGKPEARDVPDVPEASTRPEQRETPRIARPRIDLTELAPASDNSTTEEPTPAEAAAVSAEYRRITAERHAPRRSPAGQAAETEAGEHAARAARRTYAQLAVIFGVAILTVVLLGTFLALRARRPPPTRAAPAADVAHAR